MNLGCRRHGCFLCVGFPFPFPTLKRPANEVTLLSSDLLVMDLGLVSLVEGLKGHLRPSIVYFLPHQQQTQWETDHVIRGNLIEITGVTIVRCMQVLTYAL